jgi:hypothetical protein
MVNVILLARLVHSLILIINVKVALTIAQAAQMFIPVIAVM